MPGKEGHWHGYIVEGEGDDREITVLHADTCGWSVLFHPRVQSTDGVVVCEEWTERRWDCDVAWEIDNHGYDAMPQDEGFYWIRTWFEVMPSGPWGPKEYDGGVTWHKASRPKIEVVASQVEGE